MATNLPVLQVKLCEDFSILLQRAPDQRWLAEENTGRCGAGGVAGSEERKGSKPSGGHGLQRGQEIERFKQPLTAASLLRYRRASPFIGEIELFEQRLTLWQSRR